MPYVLIPMSKQSLAPGPLANGFLPRRRNFRVVSAPHFRASIVDRPSSPHHDVLATHPHTANTPKRTAATSFSNHVPHPDARPLKPSLKSNSSAPVVSLSSQHPRTKSESSVVSKSVQFKDTDLESVRLYKPTGRPARLLSSAAASDTDTETESDASHLGDRPPSTFSLEPLEVDYARSSSLTWMLAPDANVLLESLSLPPVYDPSATPTLHGSVLVRNIAYDKEVNVRFTLDSWETVSEVRAGYDGPAGGATVGPYMSHGPWDRFRFTVSLPPGAQSRVMLLAVRYTVPNAGEWWDNNRGENYSIAFRRGRPRSTSMVLPLSKGRRGISPQRRVSAPLQTVQDQAMGVFVATSGIGAGRTALRASRAWARR